MRQSIFVFCISLLFLSGVATAEQDKSADIDEIQVLIDVSGSMKQNDPKNLRTDATQLLINLLPNNSKVSLWLFAEKTTLLSHGDAINDEWRKQTLKACKAIHSNGLYTDIETAIATVLKNGFSDAGARHLILLSDGRVDIAKDIMVSADSRERILSEWIPRLRQLRIKVQTIALSDQADKELLEKLAFDTDGWTETAQSAEQLQRLFLNMALKAAPRDSVPLDNNRFNIDASVQEFSALVFKKPNASATQLIRPDQQQIGKSQASNNIAWLETADYDLITVKQPMAGDWQIAAEIDPDNQVLILTDLQLQLQDISNFIGENDELTLKLHFTEKGQLLDRHEFLDLLTLTLAIDKQDAQAIPALIDQPGYFATTLKELGQGKHSLSIVADGKTFKREIVRDIEVVASPIRVEKLIDVAKRQVTLKFVPDIAALDSSALAIAANLYQADKTTETRPVLEHDGEWLLQLDSLPPGASLSIHFNVMAKTLDGNAISPTLAPITIDDSWFKTAESADQAERATHPDSESKDAASVNTEQQAQKPAAESDTDADSAPESKPENNWNLTIGLLALANLALCGIGYFAYKALKKAAAKKQQQLLGRLS